MKKTENVKSYFCLIYIYIIIQNIRSITTNLKAVFVYIVYNYI